MESKNDDEDTILNEVTSFIETLDPETIPTNIISISKPIICLHMIVKNESNTIYRALLSTLPVISYLYICDTGSTDNTMDIIHSFLEEHNIPGKVIQTSFKNFGKTRTEALQHCVNHLQNELKEIVCTHIMLMDADMEYQFPKGPDPFFTSIKNVECGLFVGGTKQYHNPNVRMFQLNENSSCYKYVGSTHEYIDCGELKNTIVHPSLVFLYDHGNGGSKEFKFQRDLLLLTEEFNEYENDIDIQKNGPTMQMFRTLFYLANTLYDITEFEKAGKHYLQYIQFHVQYPKNSWLEQTWYSSYRLGIIHYKLNPLKPEIYNKFFSMALIFYPNRVENIFEIFCKYWHHNKENLAFVYGLQMIRIVFKYWIMDISQRPLLFVNLQYYSQICVSNWFSFLSKLSKANQNKAIHELTSMLLLINDQDKHDEVKIMFVENVRNLMKKWYETNDPIPL